MRIGALEIAVVSDGRLRMDPALMFGPDQSEAWRRLVQLDHGCVPFSVNCLLVRVGGQGRVALPDGEVEVAPGVRLISAPGHTPGHVCIALTSGQEMAIYTGDLLHHAAQLDHPEWSPAFDLLPRLSAESRRRILE